MNSKKNVIVHEGGSGSSKTYSILQYIFFLCLMDEESCKAYLVDRIPVDLDNDPKKNEEERQKQKEYILGTYPYRFSIVRKYLPRLRRSVYVDFLNIIKKYGYYDIKFHNQSPDNLTYTLNGHTIEFFAPGDDPEGLRGPRRDFLYINEGLEFEAEDWRQLVMRTNIFTIADYNPSYAEHWLYNVADDTHADLFVSTYLDNNFLSSNAKKEIEKTKATNPEFFKVYGEGKRAKVLKGKIYEGWEFIKDLPDGEIFYGLDFGWHPDPISLVKIISANDAIYVKQLIYSTKTEVGDVIRILTQHSKGTVYCDHNSEQSIEELKRAGIHAVKAKKGAGSILEGINFLKRAKVFVTEDSKDIWIEYSTYKWKLKKGFDPDDDAGWESVPADGQKDHAMDSIRYGYYSHYFKGKEFFVV